MFYDNGRIHSNGIVIINQDVGYLFVDLANKAVDVYERVVLLSGSIVELGARLDDRVVVLRTVKYRRTSVVMRLISWLMGFVHTVWLLRTRYRGFDVVASSNPPLNTFLPLVTSNRTGLYVLDLYPEALHETGMLSQLNPIVRGWTRLNARAYKRFHHLWALTPSMKTIIERDYGAQVDLVSAWASEMELQGDPSILDREGITEFWVVLYSGNLGREHDIECLLDCARRLVDCRDLLIVIAGEGWKKKAIEDRVAVEKLENVRLFPKLPYPEFAALVSYAKVGVVTQSLRTADVCIPSKTFNLLSAGLAILGIGKPDSDFGRLIEQSGSGKVFCPNDVSGICEFLTLCWQSDQTLQLFRHRAQITAKSYTRDNATWIVDAFGLRGARDR